jgi:hypothetical protein
MRRLLLIVILMLSSTAFAQENTINRQEWIDAMQGKLPPAFCQSKSYFRQCFRVTESECLSVADNATRLCLGSRRNEIPPVLVQPNDGGQWGSVVGECAGVAYEAALKSKRINSDRCNDANNWI